VAIGGLVLHGPVLAASGTYGYGDEFGARIVFRNGEARCIVMGPYDFTGQVRSFGRRRRLA
jgi:hypothetical protein